MFSPLSNKRGLSKFIIILILGSMVAVIAAVVIIIIQSKAVIIPKPVNLSIWGVLDDTTDLNSIISSYQKLHPYIKINYKKLRYEEYENMLIDGWATDTGPDVFAIPNSWIIKYQEKYLAPLPKTTQVAYYTTKKVLFKTETKIVNKTENSLTTGDIKRNFIDAVYNDVVVNGQIYSLPLSINTLVLFYNRDLLNQAHVVQPPKTWSEFPGLIPKITLLDEQNNIARAGVALGTYDNIPRAVDIVTLLMLQNGATMTMGDKITFHQPSTSDKSYYPATEALRFYTDFAAPEKSVYTWNKQMANALDLFASGKLALFFGYPYQEADIKAKNQGVDYGIAAMPQVNPNNEINYANYWTYTVAKKSKYANEAWNFLQHASSEKAVKKYLSDTKQTSVLRSLLNSQLADPDIGILAQQALTAQSWYRGRDPQQMETDFAEMINNASDKTQTIQDAVNTAAKKIQEGY